MADKRISDFATLNEAKDNDLLLVSSQDETYNMKVLTFKNVVTAAVAEEVDPRIAALEAGLKNVAIDVDDLGLYQDPTTGYVYPTYRGEISENGIPLAASGGGGGGGGSGNNATLTLTNKSGWLAKTISTDGECKISVEWSSVENDIPTGNGTMTVRVDGTKKATMDVAQGTVTVDVAKYLTTGSNKVKVTVTDVYDNARTVTYTITVVELSISSTFDSSVAYSSSNTVPYTYTPVGAVEKTVYFVVDGRQIATATVAASGRQQTQNLPAMTHGSHTLLVYFTAEIEGSVVKSNELYYELIVVSNSSTLPIIASAFRETTVMQYTTLAIPYSVYTPASMTSSVELYANGEKVATLTVDRTVQTWSYRPDVTGLLTLKIVSGPTTKIFSMTVTESDIHVEAETDSLALYLTSYGRNNSEDTPARWRYENISATLSNFNFVSDGWIKDKDGVTVLHVTGDARVEIPYKPFEKDFRTTGKTIEIEFATSGVLDYDAVILSCMNSGRGIELTAQKATLCSEQSTISTQYKENEHVRISFVTEKRSENRLLYIYINGIMSGAVQYPTDDDFSQITPANITIGNNNCAIDIYAIRVYDNNLTRHQILNNWIADTQKADDLLERYAHNAVYDDYGSVVIDKLPSDLPYLVITSGELPQYKGDKKIVSGYYVDPVNPALSFTFVNAEIDVQGTSSQTYARKNYKIKFKGGFILPNGNTAATYRMRVDAIATDTFTFKADVASSEGANNVELARLYNDACPYKTPAQTANSAVRQGIDGFPIVVFWDNGSSVSFIGKYNFNNDKGTEEVFGFVDGDESWEVRNNTSNRVLWKSADYSGTDWLNDFEARFPDGNTDPSNLKAFAEWLVSTDTTAATNATLPAAVEYGGVSYTKDTAAYRLAKFRAELGNYVEKDSAIFYYLFTELFLMVDSRAKNMFPSFLGGEVSTT